MSNEEVKDLVLSADQKALLTNYANNYAAVKAIEKDMKEEVAKIKEVMIANNVQEIDNGDYVLKLSAVKGVALAGDIEDVPEEFTKVVLDTAKTNAQVTLTGELPAGVKQTTTYKLNAPKAKK
jgi:tRNA-dihydrouridine synthase